jgi:ParB-like chromosome segregation protein Spo0J
MSDIDSALSSLHDGDDAPIPSVREGLPPRYRMRADAHYVEQLDSALFKAPIRFMDVQAIDSPRPDDGPTPSAAFIDSIRRHGVLQPLLVRSRGGRHVVIAGRKRLAAAVAAGLREVPCLVERVDDEQAQTLAAASNVAAMEPAAPRPAPAPAPAPDLPLAALAECLTAVASSAGLLSSGATLTQAVAVDLVRAEAARALQLLVAMRVLKGEAVLSRRSTSLRLLIDRTLERSASERRLRGVALEADVQATAPSTVWGDEELLISAFGTLVMATAALIDAPHGRTATLRATRGAEDTYIVTAVHDVELPHHWRSKLVDDSREALRSGDATAPALVLLRAARRIAELHGGHMTLDCADGRTNVSMEIPNRRS